MRPADNPVEQFYAIIEAELRATEKVGPVDFDYVWTQIKARSDIAHRHKDTVVGLGVDGVRPVFQNILLGMRRTDALAKLVQVPSSAVNNPGPFYPTFKPRR